ncbi:MAG: hypothetical protein P8X79_09010, partial [Reinekea sp.]
NAKKATPAEQFETAWQQLQKQQKQNAKLEQDVVNLAKQVREQLAEPELNFAQALYDSCEHLLKFVNYKSLSDLQRATLFEWCTEYMGDIIASPFACGIDISPLQKACQEALEKHYPDLKYANEQQPWSESEDVDIEKMFSDLFDEPEATGAENNATEDEPFDGEKAAEDFFERFFGQKDENKRQREAEGKSINQMLKASSINKMFRKIARVLHPDREQDETLKAEKNRLMGTLIEARDNNNIPEIFALYSEYVGESPTTEIAEDIEEVTQMLKHQCLHLQVNKLQFLAQDPFLELVHERFYRRSKAARQKAINEHLEELEEMRLDEEQMISEVQNLKTLKSYMKSQMQSAENLYGFAFVGY